MIRCEQSVLRSREREGGGDQKWSAVCLAKSLKNKLGFTTVVSVEEVKKGEEKPAEPIQLASSYIHYPHYPAVQYYYDGLGTFT
ncbi:unnamed protein product [Malus baccata var. baccata]